MGCHCDYPEAQHQATQTMVSMGCPDLSIKFFARETEPALALRKDTLDISGERDTVATTTSTTTFIQEGEIHRAHSVGQALAEALGTQ